MEDETLPREGEFYSTVTQSESIDSKCYLSGQPNGRLRLKLKFPTHTAGRADGSAYPDLAVWEAGRVSLEFDRMRSIRH